MLAIDTNVVVRCLVDEHPEQCRRARALVVAASVFPSATVLLETEWILRGVIGLGRRATLTALRDFIDLPTVFVENEAATIQACEWAEQGMDFADALHLANAANCEAFMSFDKKLAKSAAKLGRTRVREP